MKSAFKKFTSTLFVAVFAVCNILSSDAFSGDQQRRPFILAHYMPWYTAKPYSERWGWHWTMNQFDPEQEIDGQRQIASKYYPLIGPYDSGNPHVLEYHLLTMKLAGIDGVIVDWYGLTDFRDYAILHRNTTRILQQCERLKMKFVICYEDQTIPALVEGNRLPANERVQHAVEEIDWLGKYWFKSGSYVKLDDKPVLLSFGHAGLNSEEWQRSLSLLESPVAYFSQDIRRDGAIGGFGWPAPKVGMKQVDRFFKLSGRWPAAIPAAFPRFDDVYKQAGLGEGYPVLPDDAGQTFRTTLQMAMNSKPNFIQIATWNDWGEGTQIEPSIETGFRDLEHLQSICFTPEARPSANDLRLPLKLFELRRTTLDTSRQKEHDEISMQLAKGQFKGAREMLKKYSFGSDQK